MPIYIHITIVLIAKLEIVVNMNYLDSRIIFQFSQICVGQK